jgi:hypothetical protein
MFALAAIAFGALLILGALYFIFKLFSGWRRMAREGGYTSLGAYLNASPRNTAEKQAAADMALQGLVLCLVGFILPPLLLIGVFPLYFGARKLAHARIASELFDDLDGAA